MKTRKKLEVVWEYEYSPEDEEIVAQAFAMILGDELLEKGLQVCLLPSSHPRHKMGKNDSKHITTPEPSGSIHEGKH